MRRTKIVCTIGPASSSREMLDRMVAAGMDVARLNFSHGTHEEHAEVIRTIRDAESSWGHPVTIVQDLQGPKVRLGRFVGGQALLLNGETFTLSAKSIMGTDTRATLSHPEFLPVLKPGDQVWMDDGMIQLVVQSAAPEEAVCRVTAGGVVSDHKGISLPRIPVPVASLTEKDREDLRFGIAQGVDYVAVSFVRTASDIQEVKRFIHEQGADLPIIAKLERAEVVGNLPSILPLVDAVMVARGDLGLEIPLERVPRVQKEILRKARAASVPVIVATQVLESMRTEPRPTRAEASDAAGAVDGGADAIMLSGETATGFYPVRSVEVLDAIIRDTESIESTVSDRRAGTAAVNHVRALCEAAVQLSRRAGAFAVVAVTREGQTAKMLSAIRPQALIVGVTDKPDVARCLSLWHGVMPMVSELEGDTEQIITRVVEAAVKRIQAPENATMVVVNTSVDLDRGSSNFVRIRRA